VRAFPGLRFAAAWAAAMLLLTLAGALLAGGSAAAAVTTCATAFAMLEAGNLTAFQAVKPPDSTCARQGATAEADLAEAQQLIALNLDSVADAKIVQALQAEPLLSVRDVLSRTVGPASITLAEALDRDGFHAQAVAVLLQTIDIDPGLPLDQEARSILGLSRQPWYLRLAHSAVSSSDVVTGELILLLLIVVAAVPRLRRRLYLQPFTAADGVDSGASHAATLRTLIREELARMARESAQLPGGRRLKLHIAGPYDDQDRIGLGQLRDDLPATLKVVYQVICLVLRWTGCRSSLVTGALQSGEAVELDLKAIDGRHQRGEIIKRDSIGFPAPGGASPGKPLPAVDQVATRLKELAVPAAAWIILARYRKVTLGGTRSPASYVAFAAGCAWEAEATPRPAGTARAVALSRERRRARECYRHACRDPENTAAAINLAMLEKLADTGTGPLENRPWYQTLLRVASQTGGRRFLFCKRGRRDLQWYRANYLLSSAQREFLESRPSLDRAVLKDIDAEARQRAVEVAIELEKRAGRRGGLPAEFAEYGRSAALTLLARQTITRTADPGQVISTRRSPRISQGGLRRELTRIKRNRVDSDASAKLVEFTAEYRPIDDQSEYNLALYRHARYKNCVSAIGEYQNAVNRSSGDRREAAEAWRADVGRYMDRLEEECQLELAEMKRWEERVREANDPVLAVEVAPLQRIERNPLTRANSHDLFYRETGERLPPPSTAPPFSPPAEQSIGVTDRPRRETNASYAAPASQDAPQPRFRPGDDPLE
jgi:hypothetical protein